MGWAKQFGTVGIPINFFLLAEFKSEVQRNILFLFRNYTLFIKVWEKYSAWWRFDNNADSLWYLKSQKKPCSACSGQRTDPPNQHQRTTNNDPQLPSTSSAADSTHPISQKPQIRINSMLVPSVHDALQELQMLRATETFLMLYENIEGMWCKQITHIYLFIYLYICHL